VPPIIWVAAFPRSLLVRIEEAFIVVVILVHAHYSFIYLPHHALSFLKFIDITFDHYELIFYISALDLRVKLLLTQVAVGQSFLEAILGAISLEVNKSIL
jgi:hypothetical protein